jgi:RNA polymerase sigma factor (sigma-70 family)
VDDGEVVAAIVAGDPRGIAEAYDRYAMPLYVYCRSMLREPADAADAVQDTFLIATAKLDGLKDPGKLRPWLYAVARNECLRQLRSGRAVSALDQSADVPAESADVSSAAERAELRDLLREAVNGLNPAERDVIELSLGAGLAGGDLADALGVSRNHAHALLSRARSQLERSLGALVVARTGRDACPALEAVLAGWDGQLTVLMRKRISRHIERCEICGQRKRSELSPAFFAGAMPMVALLPGFREQVLRACADHTPAGLANRASVTARAGSFGSAGFPKSAGPPGSSGWPHAVRPSRAAVASAATAVAAAGVGAVLFIGGAPHGHAPGPGSHGSAGPGSVVNTRGAPVRRQGAPPAGGGSGPSPAPGSSAAAAALGQATSPATPGAPGPVGTAPGSSAPGSSAPGSSAPGSSAPASSPAIPGKLAVSPSTLVLVAVSGQGVGTFTLTAEGGPVSGYSVSAPSGLAVSPASGSLAAGASVTITVRSASLISLDDRLTINPGGVTVTVVLNVSL